MIPFLDFLIFGGRILCISARRFLVNDSGNSAPFFARALENLSIVVCFPAILMINSAANRRIICLTRLDRASCVDGQLLVKYISTYPNLCHSSLNGYPVLYILWRQAISIRASLNHPLRRNFRTAVQPKTRFPVWSSRKYTQYARTADGVPDEEDCGNEKKHRRPRWLRRKINLIRVCVYAESMASNIE